MLNTFKAMMYWVSIDMQVLSMIKMQSIILTELCYTDTEYTHCFDGNAIVFEILSESRLSIGPKIPKNLQFLLG